MIKEISDDKMGLGLAVWMEITVVEGPCSVLVACLMEHIDQTFELI